MGFFSDLIPTDNDVTSSDVIPADDAALVTNTQECQQVTQLSLPRTHHIPSNPISWLRRRRVWV